MLYSWRAHKTQTGPNLLTTKVTVMDLSKGDLPDRTSGSNEIIISVLMSLHRFRGISKAKRLRASATRNTRKENATAKLDPSYDTLVVGFDDLPHVHQMLSCSLFKITLCLTEVGFVGNGIDTCSSQDTAS
jgi:hypothetical protein